MRSADIRPADRPSDRYEARSNTKPQAKTVNKKVELTRIFNSVLVSSQAGIKRDFSTELGELTESAAFKAILNAVSQLAGVQGIPERQAAEEIVETFRKLDEIWSDYIFREGIDRVRGGGRR